MAVSSSCISSETPGRGWRSWELKVKVEGCTSSQDLDTMYLWSDTNHTDQEKTVLAAYIMIKTSQIMNNVHMIQLFFLPTGLETVLVGLLSLSSSRAGLSENNQNKTGGLAAMLQNDKMTFPAQRKEQFSSAQGCKHCTDGETQFYSVLFWSELEFLINSRQQSST